MPGVGGEGLGRVLQGETEEPEHQQRNPERDQGGGEHHEAAQQRQEHEPEIALGEYDVRQREEAQRENAGDGRPVEASRGPVAGVRGQVHGAPPAGASTAAATGTSPAESRLRSRAQGFSIARQVASESKSEMQSATADWKTGWTGTQRRTPKSTTWWKR